MPPQYILYESIAYFPLPGRCEIGLAREAPDFEGDFCFLRCGDERECGEEFLEGDRGRDVGGESGRCDEEGVLRPSKIGILCEGDGIGAWNGYLGSVSEDTESGPFAKYFDLADASFVGLRLGVA